MQRVLLLLAVLLGVLPAYAATMYISDELTVPLRRGPSNAHRILHAGLPSGTPLEILGEDKAAGFTQVRTPNGTEGWVPSQYLTGEPVAKSQLAAAQRRVQSLVAELKALRSNFLEVRGARTQVEGRAADLDKQTLKLQAELAEVRRISANAIAQSEEHKKLKSDNQQLQAQTSQLSERVRSLERNVQLRWLLFGGGLVVIGLVIGVTIKSRPKRSSWA
jgi:SH3 domain protein